ncbi:RNA-binding domain-containing protein [Neocallimastix californiae]|uniref:RNA-binding domain-containing protein n=1 Tax=Neocallimastix californiae TaxID=1754190 RepID=A0A1Y2E4E4_9FUNG|nr:RNA-binding domain-containing protein [Neocallimastix californiae]|eukprot:ORY65735.1 RNA-binding domain-containing protein [Neocallimastix californiae]
MHQIPVYPSNQIAGYSPQGQQNHQQRYNRHNNRRSQSGASNASSNGHSNNSSKTTNVYISGLSPDVTDESFAEMCNSYGKIISSKAIINNETNECKGFGFVMYENEEQARNAMNELNKKGFHVSFAKDSLSARLKNLQDEESTNIYISNIPLNMTNEQFLELFAPHNVISHTILKDQNGVSRGVGFAR